MAYIGRNPAIGTQKVLDSLESQFNGVLTTFDLRYLSNTIYPPIASALIVSLGGVLQEPGEAYTVASDTITFSSAPLAGTDCWILLYTEFGGAAGATANLTVSNNLTIGNELHGPANFVIDPATIGDNTGTVEIKGDLTVQGTTTTINSTTLTVDDKNITLASGAANAAAADGAGITVDGANATLTYNSTPDAWSFNKNVGINTSAAVVSNRLHIHSEANDEGILLTQDGDNYSAIVSDANRTSASNSILHIDSKWNGTTTSRIIFETGEDTTNKDDGRIKFQTAAAGTLVTAMRIDSDGYVGIGGNHEPLSPLHISVNTATLLRLERESNANAAIRYQNDVSSMFAGLSSNANFFGISPSENLAASTTQFVVERTTGNVGIGTIDPVGTLHVAADAASIYLQETDASADNGIWAYSANGEELTWQARNDSLGGGGNLFKMTRTGNSIDTFEAQKSATTWFIIDNTTKEVGIGTTSPSEKLTIGSTATSDNYLRINSANNTDSGIKFYSDMSATKGYLTGYRGNGNLFFIQSDNAGTITDRFVINDNGNVGIGTTNPTSLLHLAANAPYITFEDIDNNQDWQLQATAWFALRNQTTASELLRVTHTGNVGIGITNPVHKLDVAGDVRAQGGALILNYADANNIDHIWHDDATVYGAPGNWYFISDGTYKSTSNTVFSNITVGHVYVDNGNLGTTAGNTQDLARFYANNGNATSIRVQSKRKVAGTNWTSASMKIFCNTDVAEQGYIEFNPHTSVVGDGNYDVAIGSVAGEIIRFKDGGNVGIGTTSPVSKLEVVGDITITNGTQNNAIRTNAAGQLQFMRNSPTNNTVAVTIDDDTGYVGIGTDSPVNLLQLTDGDATLSNNKYIGFNIYNDGAWKQVGAGNGAVLKHNSTSGFQIYTGADSGNGAGGAASVGVKLTINDNGNVGIGTNNPQEKLDVQVGASSGYGRIKLADGSTVSATFEAIRSSTDSHSVKAFEATTNDGNCFNINYSGGAYFKGDVGIGTTSPQGKLHVEGGGSYAYFKTNTDGVAPVNSITGLAIGWNRGSGTRHVNFVCNSGQSAITAAGGFQFSTQTNTGTFQNQVTIAGNGNVGIGNTNPAYKLEVEGDIKVGEQGTLWFSDAANSIEKIVNTGGTLNLFADSDVHFYESDANVRKFTVDVNDGQLHLGSNLDTTTAQVHFDYHATSYINGSLFGLGTTSPAANLQVEYGSASYAATTIRIGTTNDLNIDRIYSLGWGDPSNTQMGMGPYSSARGIFDPLNPRHGLAIHVHQDDEFSIRSTGFDKLFGIEGGTGRAYHSGNVGFGTVDPQCTIDMTGHMEINGSAIGGILTSAAADDTYVDVTTPVKGGHCMITGFSTYDAFPQPVGSGMMYFDVGNSRLLAVVLDTEVQRTGSTAKLISGGTSTSTTATDWTDGAVTVTTPAESTLRFFNRTGSARQFKIVFL